MAQFASRATGVLAPFLTLACASTPAPQSLGHAQDSLDVRAAYDDRVAGLETGDLERWLGAHAPTVRFLSPDGDDVVGTEGLRAWGQPFFSAYTMKTGEHVQELVVEGDVAFLRVDFAAEFLPKGGGAPALSRGKMVLLLRRGAGGKWKVAHNIWNSPSALPKT